MKKGFTLAEVLITLAIIGVVAALTIPTVVHKYQKHVTAARLKVAYSTLSNVFQLAESKDGVFWYNESGFVDGSTSAESLQRLDEVMNVYLIPYMKPIESGKKTLGEFGYKNDLMLANGGIFAYKSAYQFNGMKLQNGMFLFLATVSHGNKLTGVIFVVDLDGPSHGANIVGKDVFVLTKVFSSNPIFSKLQFYGSIDPVYVPETGTFRDNSRTREELLNYCKNINTRCCGALIMRDGWQIKDDYPWL